MLYFPRWKIWGISLICAIGVLMAVPSLLPAQAREWLPGWAQAVKINLGLDLAGGSHLLLEAETPDVARQRLEGMEETIRREMRRAAIGIRELSTSGGTLSFSVRDPAQADEAARTARNQAQPVGFSGSPDWDVRIENGSRIVMRQSQAGIDQAAEQAMEVARDVIDRRINASGTLEPTIIRQGSNRIVVQVPGVGDPEALKALIGRTARLEFKLLAENVTAEQLQSGRAPIGTQILPYPEGGEGARIAVQRRAMVTGDRISNASQDFDENGLPAVTIRFDGAGSQAFARVTQENTGKRFAIILDNVVLSAPTIREPILGGSAQISGSFTVQTANDLAISLRSGRLPVELHVVEERTVGPDLGRESIQKGVVASIVATLVVILFMLITYGRFGVYTTIGLVLNALMILGLMAFFNATLTLPGIAGFVLTIGAAVDANVLINERIREEQRRGRRLHDALESGYREASTAIFDANITNVIAAVLMYYFGSGPIRGFAVVLMIGIVTSVFTAVNVTRMLVALWVRRARPKELHI
jgi:preprotein translocase subunit SecD